MLLGEKNAFLSCDLWSIRLLVYYDVFTIIHHTPIPGEDGLWLDYLNFDRAIAS